MFRLYFITAWRNLKKNKVVSIINIAGLTVGLTCSIFAIYYSINELSYENCHEQADNISKVYSLGKFGSIERLPDTYSIIGDELKDRFPEIEQTSVSRTVDGIVYKDQEPLNQDGITIATASLFDLFTINIAEGIAPVAGQEIMLSRKMANRYFGNENCLGKSISISIWGQKLDYIITGIFEDLKKNTHLNISSIIPFDMARKFGWETDGYNTINFDVYALTPGSTDLSALNNKIAANYQIPVEIEDFKIALIPIKRIHLHETIAENNFSNLLIILIGGIVSLILSCFSYINLTAILFSMRRQEVGVKKVNGSGRKEIIFQFLMDTGLAVLISFGLAYFLFIFLLPEFNILMNQQLSESITMTAGMILIATFLFTTVFSGILPAWTLSGKKPLSLIRKTEFAGKANGLKNTLLTLQFIVAIILLQFFIISNRQTNYLFNEDISGYNSDNIFTVDGWEWGDLNTVKNELLKSSAIEYVSWGSSLPGINFSMTTDWKNEENKEMAQQVYCAEDYTKVFKIKMADGRFFSEKYQGDIDKTVIINSLTANSLGHESPVGKTMLLKGTQYQIIGLVDDYLAVPPIFDEMPLILIKKEDNKDSYLVMRINEKNIEEARSHIISVLRKANPDHPINLRFYDELVADLGGSFVATGVLMNLFTFIIIINAMIGLFGLSFFIAQHKNKEVGIRKVCGASINSVIWRLSKGFALKLILALTIATPITFLAGGEFVKTFTRHISMTPDLFILGGSLAFIMVVIASGWKITIAAIRNPVEALRYE